MEYILDAFDECFFRAPSFEDSMPRDSTGRVSEVYCHQYVMLMISDWVWSFDGSVGARCCSTLIAPASCKSRKSDPEWL